MRCSECGSDDADVVICAACHAKKRSVPWQAKRRLGAKVVDSGGTKALAPATEELKIIQRIREMRALGMSFHAIAKTLREDGTPTVFGGLWWAMTVRRALARD